MSRQLDKTITTLRNFKHATNNINDEVQIFIQRTGQGDNDSSLVEITEIQLVLPKDEDEESYLVLRSK